MNFKHLESAIEEALEIEPRAELKELCQGYYFPYYMLLHILAGQQNGVCVELGVDKGRGCRFMLESVGRDNRVFGVEQNDKECFQMSHPKLTLLKCSSTPVPQAIQDAGKISVLHIDTEHSYARAEAEFNAYKPFLADGAVVCFDDTNAMEGDVWRFVESLPYEKIRDDRLHPGCGYAVLIYRENV